MKSFPELQTERLMLNRPLHTDADDLVQHLGADSAFSENTLNIPFPYKKEDAEFFLNELVDKGFETGNNFIFAIRKKGNPKLIGAIGIHPDKNHHKAEVGYWLAKEFWNNGYISEALKQIIQFGFKELKLQKIYASHFPHNPASGKIMLKCGMEMEACLKKEYFKNGQFMDVYRYSILK
ncbi:GNAT family N-acetyltransferase [Chryseobacterium koreense]